MKPIVKQAVEWWVAWFIAVLVTFGMICVFELCTFERSWPLW
jgi:hypothetical protein